MSAIVCGKRSFFEDLQSPSPTSASPPVAKKIRCSAHFSPPRSVVAPTFFIDQLRAAFPEMENELIEKTLEECGYDLDSAIKRLNELRIGYVHGNLNPVPETHSNVNNVAASNVGEEVLLSEDASKQNNLPKDGAEWVELFLREMNGATSIDDARSRAARVLESLERSISARVSAEATENIQKENIMLKEQIEVLLRENSILKRAVAIQHERQKEYDDKNEEVQQLKQMVAQYQEQLRNLEVEI
ncbi:OLC1v1037529C1 [Oldenlandia corymbosa var. corymbosa]|uniref:OLC1v1037529C1 n=1 Tax=Oldenlandia corymbosa var. corymbosa TaxID=529605 RepID=A0AAV1E1J6_OLDCO|nr:OLC1v1037529C1 [Oldenlandia corymbosa var. corymbosa]